MVLWLKENAPFSSSSFWFAFFSIMDVSVSLKIVSLFHKNDFGDCENISFFLISLFCQSGVIWPLSHGIL